MYAYLYILSTHTDIYVHTYIPPKLTVIYTTSILINTDSFNERHSSKRIVSTQHLGGERN